MATKRRFHDSYETFNEYSSNNDDRVGIADTDVEGSELLELFGNESEADSDENSGDSDNVSTDEDD